MLIVPDVNDVYTPLQSDVIVQLSEVGFFYFSSRVLLIYFFFLFGGVEGFGLRVELFAICEFLFEWLILIYFHS